MDTCQVNKTFFRNKLFKGVFPCDQLPKQSHFDLPYGLIVNTDPSSKPGEHWFAIFVNENNHAEIFDSFGKPPTNKYIIEFIERNTESSCYNTIRIQHDKSEKYGQFSIGYIKARLNGFSADDFLSIFDHENLMQNDQVIDQLNKRCSAYQNRISECKHK